MDDRALVRAGLRHYLHPAPDLRVVWQAANASAAAGDGAASAPGRRDRRPHRGDAAHSVLSFVPPPLRERDIHIRFSEDFKADAGSVLTSAGSPNLEGVIAKRADAPYVTLRSETWLKIKCKLRRSSWCAATPSAATVQRRSEASCWACTRPTGG
ncbi:MAG: hypothetical protein REJ50_14450 [Bordetella sp.]|nr:hypothetical protein [Bordetella sp.]